MGIGKEEERKGEKEKKEIDHISYDTHTHKHACIYACAHTHN